MDIKLRAFARVVRTNVEQAILAGADAYAVTLTIPKSGLKPSDVRRALDRAWLYINRRNRFASLGDAFIGWARAGELGEKLSPHFHMIVCVKGGTKGVRDQVRGAWRQAVQDALGLLEPPKRLNCPVKRLSTSADCLKWLAYMAKGDKVSGYTPKQKNAWELSVRGWHNLRTSHNWTNKKRRAFQTHIATGIAEATTGEWLSLGGGVDARVSSAHKDAADSADFAEAGVSVMAGIDSELSWPPHHGISRLDRTFKSRRLPSHRNSASDRIEGQTSGKSCLQVVGIGLCEGAVRPTVNEHLHVAKSQWVRPPPGG